MHKLYSSKGMGKDEKEVQKKEKFQKKLRNFFRNKQKQVDAGTLDIYYELAVSARRVRDGEVSPPPEVASMLANPGEDDATTGGTPANPVDLDEPHEINFFDIEFLGSIGGGCYGNYFLIFYYFYF